MKKETNFTKVCRITFGIFTYISAFMVGMVLFDRNWLMVIVLLIAMFVLGFANQTLENERGR